MKRVKYVVVTIVLIIAMMFCVACNNSPSDDGSNDNNIKEAPAVTYINSDAKVADIVCSEENGYAVDKTGKEPSTMGIQSAIDDCYALGGGTVYLPAGDYLVSARINLRPYVTLVGDYVSPDNYAGDYGTVILAGVKSTTDDVGENVNLIRMYGSTGLIGITFFYPDQYADIVMPYGYTVEIPGGIVDDAHNVFTIKNVTFLNAYKGICASITKHSTKNSITHEQLHLENISGTVLREGVHLTNSSEVGTFRGIKFTPGIWANSDEVHNAPSREEVIAYTKAHSVGMILGDLEWQEIRDISLEGYHTGIYFTDGDRVTNYSMSFIGSLYNVSVTDAVYGIYVEQMYEHMGIQFYKTTVSAEKYAVINNSPVTDGHMQFSCSTLNGAIAGYNIYWDTKTAEEGVYIKTNTEASNTADTVYNVVDYGADNTGKTDCSEAIQNALDLAREAGGGIVYLPAGYYKLENPVTVYQNTELRGSSVVNRDLLGNCRGTMILNYYGKNDVNSDTARALITLDGDYSGVTGLRVATPELNLFEKVYTADTLPKYNYIVRASGNGNYCANLYLEGVYNGVDFGAGCENSVINKVMGAIYNVGIRLGGKNQTVTSSLQNAICILKISPTTISDFVNWGTYTTRSNLLHSNVYGLTRYSSKFIVLENAENAVLDGVFCFASERLIEATNSTFTGINLGCDSQPGDSGAMFVLKDSKAVCYNTLRDVNLGGEYLINPNSSFTVYNRISLIPGKGYVNESNIVNNNSVNMSKFTLEPPFELEKIWLK